MNDFTTYKYNNTYETSIYWGIRGKDFRDLLLSVLRLGKIKEHYIEYLLSEDGMKIYNEVFTSDSVNPDHNYEMYEQMGDVLAGSFIIWYMYRLIYRY